MTASLSWFRIVRLGLVQAALGSMVVLVTSTLNRVMVVELALPALVPGALVALHYAVQVLRPRLGYGSDAGGRRTSWIVGGILTLALGTLGAGAATALMATNPAANPVWGIALAVPAFVLVGLGVGAAGTSLLALMAHHVSPRRRAPAATILWLMMIAGIAVTATVAGKLLDPFTPARLLTVTGGAGAIAVMAALLGVWGIEGAPAAVRPATRQNFLQALREVWSEPEARRFALFVFMSMLAYSAQELVLEPFAGAVFRFTPGQSAGLTGLQHIGVLAGMAIVAVGSSLAGEYRGRAMRAWTVSGCVASAAAISGLAVCSLTGPGAPVQMTVLVLGVANGAFAISAISAMMGLAAHGRPAREGTRLGVWGAAQALAFGAGGLAGTGATDLARMMLGTASTAYAAVFVAEALLFLAAAGLALRVFGTGRTTLPAPDGALQPG